MKKVKRTFLYILIFVLVIGLGGGSFAVFGTYSSGSRAGVIVKYSTKGLFFKTNEGELNVGGISKGEAGDIMPTIWNFSVYRGDQDIDKAIQEAVLGGHRVRLHYEEKYFQFDWRGDTKYFITMVEKVPED